MLFLKDLNNRKVLTQLALVIFIGAMTIFVACVSTKSTYINPSIAQYNPVPPDSVYIFTTEAELDTLEYVRIALIEAKGSGEWTSQTGMINAMRKKAGKLGANGILLPAINEPGAGAKVAGAIFGVGTERKGNVVAIRILGTKPRK
jgi:hypothetical protein